jgi:hypothetical protein
MELDPIIISALQVNTVAHIASDLFKADLKNLKFMAAAPQLLPNISWMLSDGHPYDFGQIEFTFPLTQQRNLRGPGCPSPAVTKDRVD